MFCAAIGEILWLFVDSDLELHLTFLVDVSLHHVILGKGNGREPIQDPFSVLGNIVPVGRMGVPVDSFAGAGRFLQLPGVGVRRGAVAGAAAVAAACAAAISQEAHKV